MLYVIDDIDGGIVVERKNEIPKTYLDANYASITAPDICHVTVLIDEKPFDGVFVGAGSSHSWWTQAGGKLLPRNGLAYGQTLKIVSSGPCALRIDWNDET